MAVDYAYIGPTCQKIEDMMQYADGIIDRWPPYYKYTLGEEIQKSMLAMLRLATEARLKYYSKTTLQKLDTEKEILKAFLRRANAVEFTDRKNGRRRLLNDHSRCVWMERVDEIGRLIGGWMNGLEKNRDDSGNTARR